MSSLNRRKTNYRLNKIWSWRTCKAFSNLILYSWSSNCASCSLSFNFCGSVSVIVVAFACNTKQIVSNLEWTEMKYRNSLRICTALGRQHKGFSVLPSDYLVACARLSVSADKRTNHASNEIKKREKNGRKRDGGSPSQNNFLNPPTSRKTVSRFKTSNVKTSKGAV